MLYLECAEQFLRLPNCQVSCSTAMAMCVVLCDLRASEAGDIET